MKKKPSIAIIASVLLLTGACAVTRQTATTTETNPTNGVVTVHVARSTTYALWDSQAVVDKTRASAGKTANVGASATDTIASSTNLAANLQALAGLLNALK